MEENFDRFKFALYKEKEMPEFRKWITALAGLALFAGLASAQVGGAQPGGGAFSCTTTNGSITPTLRSEGYTEQVGDIVLICQGGTLPGGLATTGLPVPTANFTIFMNNTVTSRLLPTTLVPNASEALLLIDEPGSSSTITGATGETGYGPNQVQIPCGSANVGVGAGLGGCTEYLGYSTTEANYNASAGGLANPVNYGVPVNAVPSATACTAAAPCAPGANVFQGQAIGNQVNFYGIPVVPPGTTGNRVYRITNIRVNANGITGGGGLPGTATASISISSGVGITQSQLTVGFISPGLNTTGTLLNNSANSSSAGSTGTAFTQCNSASTAALGTVQFTENFPTAFKTRQAGNALGVGATGIVPQNIPGTIYNSEDGFAVGANSLWSSTASASGNAYLPGQADYGTRLKALFSNVPTGVSIYVSTRDVTNAFLVPATGPFAQLVVNETASDLPSGTVPLAGQTGYFGTSASTTAVAISQVNIGSAGTGAAVWEVVQTNPAAIDVLGFAVYINYTATPASNSPAPGNITVTLSFAPTPSSGAFTASTGDLASGVLTLPRFADGADGPAKNLATISTCTTAMLFPYVVNVDGYDTGIAIANTTMDPFSTTAQQGSCNLYFYGTAAPTTEPYLSPPVLPGTVWATDASIIAPGFDGYTIAVCNFQYAHGFAFVSDVGGRNFAAAYLPLIFYNSGNLTRKTVSTGEQLNQ